MFDPKNVIENQADVFPQKYGCAKIRTCTDLIFQFYTGLNTQTYYKNLKNMPITHLILIKFYNTVNREKKLGRGEGGEFQV